MWPGDGDCAVHVPPCHLGGQLLGCRCVVPSTGLDTGAPAARPLGWEREGSELRFQPLRASQRGAAEGLLSRQRSCCSCEANASPRAKLQRIADLS